MTQKPRFEQLGAGCGMGAEHAVRKEVGKRLRVSGFTAGSKQGIYETCNQLNCAPKMREKRPKKRFFAPRNGRARARARHIRFQSPTSQESPSAINVNNAECHQDGRTVIYVSLRAVWGLPKDFE
jgi:hypothetical protein